MRDAAGNLIPSQFQVRRKYVSDQTDRVRTGSRDVLRPGEGIGAVHLLFKGAIAATGRSIYTLEAASEASVGERATGAIANIGADGSVTVETDLYRIHLDPKRGGTISSLLSKPLQREFCIPDGDAFHEFRGYFIEQKRWQSSTEHPAAVEIFEFGPSHCLHQRIDLGCSLPQPYQRYARRATDRFSHPISIRKAHLDRCPLGDQTERAHDGAAAL